MNHSIKGKRVAAAVIDIMISGFLNSISTVIFSLIMSFYIDYELAYFFISVIAPGLVYFLYYTVFPYLTKGRTLGKLMMGLRVVNMKYDNASFLQLFLRNIYLMIILIFNLIPGIIYLALDLNPNIGILLISFFLSFIIMIVIFIMIISTDDERGLHDMIANTYVVDKNFDIRKLSQATILERQNMTWAIFDDESDNPSVVKEETKKPVIEEDVIEILKQDD